MEGRETEEDREAGGSAGRDGSKKKRDLKGTGSKIW